MKRQGERSGLEREQRRREAAEAQKRRQAAKVLVASATPPVGSRPDAAWAARSRLEQRVTCGWCGGSIQLKALGRLPKWCSATCRRRAWEQNRAARSGRTAVEVFDRYVVVAPWDSDGWLELMRVMTDQVRRGQLHGVQITAALQLVQAALADQEQQLSRGE